MSDTDTGALVVLFTVAYLSGEDHEGGADLLHAWSGYAIAAIIALRLVWELIGTRHARFSDFAYSPASVRRYLTDMLHGRARDRQLIVDGIAKGARWVE